MSKQAIREILRASDKKQNYATNAIARLQRIILYDLDIDVPSFMSLLKRYSRTQTMDDESANSSFESNLVDALSKPTITFKSFERFLALLGVSGVTYTVDLHWSNGTNTSHSVKLDMIRINEDGSKQLESANDDAHEEEDN